MPNVAHLRAQIESSLARRIPSALTPAPRLIRPTLPTGLASVDSLLHGGLPLGAITEILGQECSGRTSFALSFLARITQADRVCAWVDVSNALQPESAAAAGVDLARMLWVRCGAKTPAQPHPREFVLPEKYFVPSPIKKGLHGGGHGPHPRSEIKGMPTAVSGFLQPQAIGPHCSAMQRKEKPTRESFAPGPTPAPTNPPQSVRLPTLDKPWTRLDQALRVTDLLLQAGGFSAIVLDMGSIAPEFVSRIPLATWFRYRAAAERTQASIVLLTQHPCAKSSAELALRLHAQSSHEQQQLPTLFTGMEHRLEIVRQRFAPAASNVIPLRKPVQSDHVATWQSRPDWLGSMNSTSRTGC